jgi:D-sedoheptulose 7-phosphate isomerase
MDKNLIKKSISDHSDAIKELDKDIICQAGETIINSIKCNGTIFWCGNGGSASQANHLSAELVGGMYKEKIDPFKSICLNVDTSLITAWSNDDSFDNIFVRQLKALGNKNDILIALSTSGNSTNIVKASKFAKNLGMKVISLTGNNGGILKKLSHININIKLNSTQRIQEMHILIGHIICDLVESNYRL